MAGFSATSTTSGTVGGDAYGGSVSQEFSATLSTEWSRQTGITSTDSVEAEFPVIAPAYTRVVARLEWMEEEKQKRIKGFREFDCNIEIGHYGYRQKIALGPATRWRNAWRWRDHWDSIDLLIALFQGQGQRGLFAVPATTEWRCPNGAAN